MTTTDFNAFRSLRALVANGVRFVVIGGIAGRAWGSTTITNDLDICYERSKKNHQALAAACVNSRTIFEWQSVRSTTSFG